MDSNTSAGPAKRPMRPRELEDGLNFYLYHPLAWQLARRLAHTPITPNMVSIAGGICVVLAGLAYLQPGWPQMALLGLFMHMAWHVLDGADGDLARLTGKTSPMGELIDGVCDYASHIILYLMLGWLLSGVIGGWAWGLMLGAGISHIIQANHVEVQKRSYQYWVYGVTWLRNTHDASDSATRKGGLGGIVSGYLALASGMTPDALQIDAATAAAKDDPAALERIKAAAQAEAMPLLSVLKVLGPNPRAIILGASMLVGGPQWYFLTMLVPLNLLMVWSVFAHNRAARRMTVRLAA